MIYHEKVLHSLFPSPYGDFVFQLLLKDVRDRKLAAFPSPYGDFVFQQGRKHEA